MTIKSRDYWKKRMEELEDENYQRSMTYYKDVQEQFRQASNNIQIDIERWYRRLAVNNEVSYAAAKRLLKKGELEEFKWSVEQYIKAGRENAIDQRWMKELENASVRFHISYLEAMKLQAQQHAELLSAEFQGGMTDFLHKNYAEQFCRMAFEVSKGTGVGFSLVQLDERRIDTLIKRPWAQDGKNFSDRIWLNKEKLVSTLHTELSQCIIRGELPRTAIDRLAKRMDVSKAQAGNLIMTESAAIASVSQRECYKKLGVEQYQFDATLDGITCAVCRERDQKVFKMSEFEVGFTASPIHPRCRCCTVPYPDDWEKYGLESKRAARDPVTDKMVYVDGNLKYADWKKQYVDQKSIYKNVVKASKTAIMKLPRFDKVIISEAKLNQYALNPEKDPDKAKAFQDALGYNLSNYKGLIANIQEHLPEFDAVEKSSNGHGKRYEVIMELMGPNGKKANVLTAWIDDEKTGEMRLTTAHIDRRKKK